MNADGVKRIKAALASIEEAVKIVDGLKDDEQEDFDSHSENWQDGEGGDAAQGLIDSLDGFVEEVTSQVDTLKESLDE